MHNIHTNFIKIIDVLKDIIGDEVSEKGNYLRSCSIPKFSDVEVIALSLTAECLGIDSENYLFSKLNKEYLNDFENLISRRQYNDRRKLLFEKTEAIRKSMAECINEQADIFAIDQCLWKYARYQENKEIKWVKNRSTIHRIKVTVPHRKNIFMAINYTVFVQPPG